MHIPENYLSPATCAVMAAAVVPVWVHSVRKVKQEIPAEKIPLLGVGAAFSFVGMMFNVPLPGGTTGHAVGGTLIALLLGPEAACLSVTIALLIQALLFGDGGILSFGANCFNMAFVLPYLGCAVYSAILKAQKKKSESGRLLAAGVGSYVGINAAALCTAIELGIQPMIATDASGQALYNPYPLSVSIPAMMAGHLTVFGAAEVIFTVALLAFVMRTAPSLLPENSGAEKRGSGAKPLYILLAVLICLVPLGLLAEGTAFGEWGADEIASVVVNGKALGYTPSGLANGFSLSTLLPDYTVAGLPDVAGYIVSAIVGIALTIIVFRLLASALGKKQDPFAAQGGAN